MVVAQVVLVVLAEREDLDAGLALPSRERVDHAVERLTNAKVHLALKLIQTTGAVAERQGPVVEQLAILSSASLSS